MAQYQDILHEIEALKGLNDYLVTRVYQRIQTIDSRMRSYIVAMGESGIPLEVCTKFTENRYERDRANFKKFYGMILQEHLPEIKRYCEYLTRHFIAATGIPFESWNFVSPQQQEPGAATTEVEIRDSGVQDFSVQCDAVCDFMDFLVVQVDEMKSVQEGYISCCKGLVDAGVPKQICSNYEAFHANNLVASFDTPLLAGFVDDYAYLRNVYEQIAETMRGLGYMPMRTPKPMRNAQPVVGTIVFNND